MDTRTVLLDVDGTLLDTREFIFTAYEHTLAALGLPPVAREAFAREIGRPLEEIYLDLAGDRAETAVEVHRSFQRERTHLARPFPGAAEALRALRDAGLAIAAVTSRSRRTSRLTLEAAGLESLLDLLVSAEDAPALKPDPAPLRYALDRLGRDAADAVMVGDARQDIEAGKAIGALTVAATYGFHGEALLAHEPDYAIASIRELTGVLGIG
jgi:HAD superfamily hydrolase (TIGR01509 family)